MTSRRWILPALLALPFVVVAAIDLYRWATFRSLEDVDLLTEHGDAVSFVPVERVVDMRIGPGDDPRNRANGVELVSGWGESTRQGTWTQTHRATMTWDLELAGQRVFWIEGRVDRRKGPPPRLMTVINGASCGQVAITEKWATYRVRLDPGRTTTGLNEIEIQLIDGLSDVPALDRTLLVRRMALTNETVQNFPDPSSPPPVVVRGGTAVIRRAGRFVLPFRLSVSGTELAFRYRFRNPAPGGQATVTVGRRYAGPDRFRAIREKTLSSDTKKTGRFRQILDDRFEPNVLIVDVNADAAKGGFELRELTLDAYHEPANRRNSQMRN